MYRLNALYLLLVLAMSGLACGDSAEPDPEPTSETFFEVVDERETSIERDELDREAIVRLEAANTASAFRFYRRLRGETTNLIYSPLSFSRVFSGYYFEGHPEAAAFEALFGFTPDTSTLTAWEQLFWLATNRDDIDAEDEERSLFTSTDIYWVDVNRSGEANWDYFDLVHELELKASPEESRQRINDWVESESGGMLVNFLPEGSLNPDTNAIATNLVYFLGAWQTEFDEATVEFQTDSGPQQLEAFKGNDTMLASADDDVTLVRIPYAHDYNHWVLMPANDFETFANTLDETKFAELKALATEHRVSLKMPEFSAESKPDVVEAINEIRAETMTEGGTLSGAYLETYLHQAAIDVTREGTRAAAVSAVIEYDNNAPELPDPLTVEIDRPFVHVIEDSRSGSILFLGEYTGPE